MSHFCVIVIGPDTEKQLAPYHEFECTGRDDEFVKTIDDTEKLRGQWREHEHEYPDFRTFVREWTGRKEVEDVGVLPDDTAVTGLTEIHGHRVRLDLAGEHKYGYTVVEPSFGVVATFDRTNPDKKWDWWSIGGRWTGYFPLREGKQGKTGKPGLLTPRAAPRTADQCAWGDVDIDRARAEAEERARKDFAAWREAFERYGKPESWSSIRDRYAQEDIEVARTTYNAQPAIKAMHNLWNCPVELYGFDEEAHVARQRRGALVPFAIVKDGQWYERGSMGWFGAVSDEKDVDEWSARVAELFDGLSPDTPVTAVDCHI